MRISSTGAGPRPGARTPAPPEPLPSATRKTSTETDNYGDFWLKDLPDGSYTLLIEKPGYLAQKLGPIDATAKDQNLGDIVLWKA